jgi:hypothetical protein
VPAPPARSQPSWAAIRDDDWQVYQENLRKLGCPSETIEAILVAEVQHWFDAEWASRPSETNYWMNGSARAAAKRQTRELRRQFELEERAFLEGLFGVPWHDLPAYVASLEREAWASELLGFLPDDRLDAANGLLIKFFDLWEHLEDSEPRWMTSEEIAAVRGEVMGVVGEFGRVMTPAEFEEMELRVMTVDVLDVWGVEEQFGSALSGPEFRELLRIRRGETSPFESVFLEEFLEEVGDASILPPPDPLQEQRQAQQMRALLGDARYEGYLRAQDSDYLHLSRSVRGLGLPTESVWAVYDIRRSARETVDSVRSDPSFGEADRRLILEAIRDETRLALRSSLGATAYEAYAHDGGDWVDALVDESP